MFILPKELNAAVGTVWYQDCREEHSILVTSIGIQLLIVSSVANRIISGPILLSPVPPSCSPVCSINIQCFACIFSILQRAPYIIMYYSKSPPLFSSFLKFYQYTIYAQNSVKNTDTWTLCLSSPPLPLPPFPSLPLSSHIH